MHGEFVAIPIIVVSVITGLYFIVAAGFSGRKAGALIRARADLQTKLLDRLGSGREVVEFCQTEGGKQFIEALSMGTIESPASKGSPTERILASIQKGIILTLLGLGFLLLAQRFQRDDPGDVFMVIGTVGLSLGIGFLLSAGVSYRLSRSMGLLAKSDPGGSKELFSHS
jgi:hypothetical protein